MARCTHYMCPTERTRLPAAACVGAPCSADGVARGLSVNRLGSAMEDTMAGDRQEDIGNDLRNIVIEMQHSFIKIDGKVDACSFQMGRMS
ncbi:hypothetical protein NDU88_000430 [Pleurodeles waltl]|uniref:Uncharacterized protein n=1 Tax=Pleurodeles waltl TaxID=8319 RepID=A0AAV7VTG0_PLEWA|nr:hypothetical protein NDU88_000430 [Pleurodeles waltl]